MLERMLPTSLARSASIRPGVCSRRRLLRITTIPHTTALLKRTGGPGNKWGWAGQLALSIKNIPTGPGDTINISGVYTNGASRYNFQELATAAGANMIYTGVTGVGYGFAPDSVFGPGGQLQLVSTWGMRGAFNHNWNAYWASSVFGAYASVRYNGTAKGLMCGVGGTVSC